jgi:hypothetical protein
VGKHSPSPPVFTYFTSLHIASRHTTLLALHTYTYTDTHDQRRHPAPTGPHIHTYLHTPQSTMHRALLRTPRALSRHTPLSRRAASSFGGPAPPRLPKEEQERFEQLQRESTGAFSQPKTTEVKPASASLRPQINQSPDSDSTASSSSSSGGEVGGKAIPKGDEFHPNMRRGAPPEFEGDVNPKTGEVGGPKNEPLRWKGDWSYNGRVTDF